MSLEPMTELEISTLYALAKNLKNVIDCRKRCSTLRAYLKDTDVAIGAVLRNNRPYYIIRSKN